MTSLDKLAERIRGYTASMEHAAAQSRAAAARHARKTVGTKPGKTSAAVPPYGSGPTVRMVDHRTGRGAVQGMERLTVGCRITTVGGRRI